MVCGTSTVMITRAERAQQRQIIDIVRAEGMNSEREIEKKLWLTIGKLSSIMRKWKWFSVISYKCKNLIYTAKGFFYLSPGSE
jgi:hypothetical protein